MLDFARSVHLRGFSSLSGAAVLAVAALVLSGCEVTETSGNTYNPGPMCPMIYEPVCAERRGEARTFPNACQARAENWRVVSSGQCRASDSSDFRRDRDDRTRDFRNRDRRDRDFRNRDDRSREFRASARDRNDQRDFERPRFDNRPGRDPVVRPVTPNRAQAPVVPSGACLQGSQQVCGQLGNRPRMFMNRCEMQRAGAIEVAAGQCRRSNR